MTTPTPSRMDTIRSVVDRLSQPRTIEAKDSTEAVRRIIAQNNRLDSLGHADAWKPGEASKLYKMLPPERQSMVRAILTVHDNALQLGRYGDPTFAQRATGIDKEVLDTFHRRLEDDYIVDELTKRRGSDADLPPPPLDRRDFIEAAIEAHSPTLAGGDSE